MRLIDADALKEALKSNCDLCHDKNTNWCEHCCPHNDFEDLIDDAPSISPEKALMDKLKGNEERPQGECKDCEHYYSYCGQFTNKPRGDGYCAIVRMSSNGATYINCSDNWSCADFCPKADMRGGAE